MLREKIATLRKFSRPFGFTREVLNDLAAQRRKKEAEARLELLLQFESLGENCELGMVQQAFDAHPIGLFRWSGITLPHLADALDSDLQGIGEPEHTDIYWDDIYGEYYFRDLRYGMYTHTKMFQKDYSLEEVRQLLVVRSRRLREKLIEDLQEGRKIFVFQSSSELAASEAPRLHAAVRRIGASAELLFVTPDRGGGKVGAVERVAPGLMFGFLDQVGFDGDRQPHWAISWQVWLSILASAAAACGRPPSRLATADITSLDLPKSF